MEGYLCPVESGKLIAEQCNTIAFNQHGVNKVAQMILDAVVDGSIRNVDFAAHVLHPKDGGRDALDWVFFTDTINFSFWPDEGSKYDVSYKGVQYTGWFAACAAVNKALDAGVRVVDPQWMAACTEQQVDELFKADSGASIPLLAERVKALNNSGRVLIEKWNGSYMNCVLACERSAQRLLSIIVDSFESFRDVAQYKGHNVSILKRAQILVADTYGALEGHGQSGKFHDIGSLTMFADYRVPQALAYLGVLEYSAELLSVLGPGRRIPNGSETEVELRGCSIHACELIVEAIHRLRAEQNIPDELRQIHAADVDMFVWVYRRQHAAEIEEKIPFHRTRCIYY